MEMEMVDIIRFDALCRSSAIRVQGWRFRLQERKALFGSDVRAELMEYCRVWKLGHLCCSNCAAGICVSL